MEREAVIKVASIAMILSGILWGFTGVPTRFFLSAGLSALQMGWMKTAGAALLLTVYMALFRRKWFTVVPRDVPFIAMMGFSAVFSVVFYFMAIDTSTMSLASVLLGTTPFYVILISAVLFKESISRIKAWALLMGAAGMALSCGMLGGFGSVNAFAVTIGIAAGITYGLYYMFARLVSGLNHPATVLYYSLTIVTVAMAPFVDLPMIVHVLATTDQAWWYFLMVVTLFTIVPFFLVIFALHYLEAGLASIYSFVECIVASIAGFLLYNEVLDLPAIIGIALVFVAIYLINRGPRWRIAKTE